MLHVCGKNFSCKGQSTRATFSRNFWSRNFLLQFSGNVLRLYVLRTCRNKPYHTIPYHTNVWQLSRNFKSQKIARTCASYFHVGEVARAIFSAKLQREISRKSCSCRLALGQVNASTLLAASKKNNLRCKYLSEYFRVAI